MIIYSFLCFLAFTTFFVIKAGCVASKARQRKTFSNTNSDNEGQIVFQHGILALIIDNFAHRVLRELRDNGEVEALSIAQEAAVLKRLQGLYEHLTQHPALMEQRLHVSSQPPALPDPPDVRKRGSSSKLDIARPVCPSRTQWQLLRTAKDINDTVVQVFQPQGPNYEGSQWFYTITCNNRAFQHKRHCSGCCIGIDHDKYQSSCRTKRTYVMALIRRPWELHFDWNWIQVDTSCNCAITPHIPIV